MLSLWLLESEISGTAGWERQLCLMHFDLMGGSFGWFLLPPNGMAGVGKIWSRIQEVEESACSDCGRVVRCHDASL